MREEGPLLPLAMPMKKARATTTPITRRQAMAAAGGAAFLPLAGSPALGIQPSGAAEEKLRIEELELTSVRVTERTAWMFVHLRTNLGLSGLGECSLGRRRELPALSEAFEAARGRSPFDIEAYRAAGREHAATGDIFAATAFSAIEQALWDLVGKAVDARVHELTGGKLRNRLPAYANINRATRERTPEGFAAQRPHGRRGWFHGDQGRSLRRLPTARRARLRGCRGQPIWAWPASRRSARRSVPTWTS